MDIVLITPTPPDINAFGVRTISSVLKKEGFSTRIIFLPGGIEHLRFDGSYVYRYPQKTLEQITELCKGASLIGLSFFSQYFDRAVQITEHLKKTTPAPVIWGGTHPTCRPEQSLKYSDMVCIGEGERSVVELAGRLSRGEDPAATRGCWFRTETGVRKNEPGAIVEDLDELPFVDYAMEDHYVCDWRSGDVTPLDKETMKAHFLRMPYFHKKHLYTYRTMTSRGCPHRCTYCASSAMEKLRRRSVDNVMEELEWITKKFDYVELISFFDDTFFAAPVSYFEEFRDKYKKRIGLPFHAQCSPTTISERKMSLLVDSGLYYTEMGIQTGSDRVKEMYKRVVPNGKMIEAAGLINRYSGRMLVPDYHVILDNPWETKEDVRETLDLLLALPGKFNLEIASLIFFPGTELNERARKEGILKDEVTEVCRRPFTHPKGTYLNYLIYLSGFPVIPRGLLRFLSEDFFVNLFHRQTPKRFYDFLFSITDKARISIKGVIALFTGDFARIANYFKLAR